MPPEMLLDPIRAQRRRNNMQLPRGGRMTDDRDNPLLLAVEALTKPVKRKVIQETEEGGSRVVAVVLPCLLEQIEASIYGSVVNNGGGGSSPAQERNVLDGDALFMFAKMSSAIGDWCRMAGVRATRVPADDIAAWFAGRTSKGIESDRWYERELASWRKQIETRLDPVRRMEITEPCPMCGALEYSDEEGATFRFPVIVEWRESIGQTLDRATGMCRACDVVWEGEFALRNLRWELDAKTA
jgi:hypothetical protein